MAIFGNCATHTTPRVPSLCAALLEQPHILIAGGTGSGKSVLIHDLIYTALCAPPRSALLCLIDPKRVELRQYRVVPQAWTYASEPDEIVNAIEAAAAEMENRYKWMIEYGLRKLNGPDLYIIIDEFADLITTSKKAVTPSLCRIAQLGRAAKVHLILATQRPTREILCGQIAVNIDCRIALRVPTAQDSRNIIHQSGAEQLPRYGSGILLSPETITPERIEIPMIPDDRLQAAISYSIESRRPYPDHALLDYLGQKLSAPLE